MNVPAVQLRSFDLDDPGDVGKLPLGASALLRQLEGRRHVDDVEFTTGTECFSRDGDVHVEASGGEPGEEPAERIGCGIDDVGVVGCPWSSVDAAGQGSGDHVRNAEVSE